MSELIRIPQHVFAKARYLLPMEYKVRELSEELDVPASTLKGWLSSGSPHKSDSSNHIFVYGPDFRKWVMSKRKTKNEPKKLSPDQAFCLQCNQPVTIIDARERNRVGVIMVTGTCPTCGTTVNKGIRLDQ